jgi:serine/threonine protein kinase
MPASEANVSTVPPGASFARRQELFESVWRGWRPGMPLPRWQDFLPASGESCTPEYVRILLGIDIEYRVKAGQRALLAEPYFQHERLLQPDARLDDEQQRELIRCEYQQRWQRGERVARRLYLERFPDHADPLRDLKPQGSCPRCRQTDVAIEEDAEATACLGCGARVAVEKLFPPLRNPAGLDARDYPLLDELGRGGMGEVYRSRDPGLDRVLALKVIKAEWQGKEELERRFEDEARITGSLQHPAIVPVYNLGRLRDGRLYFTMKVVRGGTLAEMVDQCSRIRQNAGAAVPHSGECGYEPGAAVPHSGECGYELPRLLGIFTQVCQAVAYAHSKGVIHRDLKPENVMVGRFGKVQVMDWGLAKVLAGPVEPRSEAAGGLSEQAPTRPRDGMETRGALGTPAYMPPEQANGEWERADERLDVFALGGILCVLLTGKPPYVGGSRQEVWRKAQRGDLAEAFARLDGCEADAELVALAKACLSPELAGRPRDASVVAQRVQAYQEAVQQRLHAAEVERAAAEARAVAERRARRWLLGLSAAVVLVLSIGIAGTAWGLWRAEKAWASEKEQRQIAEKQMERAENTEAATLADAIEELIGSKPALGPQEKAYLEKTLKRWQAFAVRTGDDQQSRAIRAEGLFRVAYLRAKLGQGEEAAAGYREALAIHQKLADDFPAVAAYRQGLASSHNNLGTLLEGENQPEQAAEQYRKALAIRQKLADDFSTVPAYRQELAHSHNKLGTLLAGQHQSGKAAEHYRKALAIRQKLVDDFPAAPAYRQELARSHGNLGSLLKAQNQPEQAAEQYRKALAILQKLTDDSPAAPAYRQDLATTHHNLGNLLADQNQADKAAEQYRKALAIQQKLAEDFPAVTAYQVDLGTSCYNFGYLLRSSGNSPESLPWYDKSIGRLAPVHEQDPRNVTARLVLRNSYEGRAWAYDVLEKHAEAVKDWNRAIELSLPREQPVLRARRANSRVRLGRIASAVAEVAELTKALAWPAGQWYDFACIYAVAAGKDAGKKKEYADRAMELLQRAVKAGYKDAAHMAKDKDLDVLRQREDFKKLMEALAKAKE